MIGKFTSVFMPERVNDRHKIKRYALSSIAAAREAGER